MRVLILNDIAGQAGGGTSVAESCVRALAAQQLDVCYVTAEPPRSPLPVPVHCLDIADIRSRSGIARAADGIYNRVTAKKMNCLLAGFDPSHSIILLHQWTRCFSPSVFAALRRYRTLVWAHNYFISCPNGAYYHFPARRPCQLQPMGAACLASNCDPESFIRKQLRSARTLMQNRLVARMRQFEIVCVSDGQRQRLGSIFPPAAATHVLDNPVPHLSVTPPPERTGLLFVGRLTPEKGVEELARAAARTKSPLHVVGDGPSLAVMKQHYPALTHEAWLDPASVRQRMASARAVVLPSLWPETFGLVAVEALHAGTPVLMSSRGCLADWIGKESYGLVFDPADDAGFDAALRRVADLQHWQPLLDRAAGFNPVTGPGADDFAARLLAILDS